MRKPLLLAFALALAGIFVLTACVPEPTPQPSDQLAAPILYQDGSLLMWGEIPEADGYKIFANDAEIAQTAEPYYRYEPYQTGEFRMKIKAFSNEEGKESDFSNEVLLSVGQAEERSVRVTESPFFAVGDGVHEDREAIQMAIDAMHEAGGGRVILTGGRTFLTGNLILKSNVELHFEDGATLRQTSDEHQYVDPVGRDAGLGTPWTPVWGADAAEWEGIPWGHAWAYNYPLLYAGEGSQNVRITGSGTIRMMTHLNCERCMHVMPMGFYRVSGLVISEVTISGYNGWACDIIGCDNVLLNHFTIKNYQCGCSDGVHLENCRDVLVTDCTFLTGDDALSILSVYQDPRRNRWSKNDDILPSKNIEIRNTLCRSAGTGTKGLAIFPTSVKCPELDQMEIENIYIHDNDFNAVGLWTALVMWGDPTMVGTTPMKNWVFENNQIGEIQSNMADFKVSGVVSDDPRLTSMRTPENGNFDENLSYWMTEQENGSQAGLAEEEGNKSGVISGLDHGNAAIFQGLHFEAGSQYVLTARVRTESAGSRLFVRNAKTGENVAQLSLLDPSWEEVRLSFTVEETGTYYLGLERGEAVSGSAWIDDLELRSPLIYSAEPGFHFNLDEEKWLQDYNLHPSDSPQTAAGQILTIAYFVTVNEVTDPDAVMEFSPLLQRQSLNWGYPEGGWGSARISYGELGSGKVLLLFRIQLPAIFDGRDDAIAPRLHLDPGIDLMWDKIQIADGSAELSDPAYRTLEVKVEGALAVQEALSGQEA